MLYLPTSIIELERLPSALLWGYIVTARKEQITHPFIERYRFEVFVRGEPIQELNISGLPGRSGKTNVISSDVLHACLKKHNIPGKILDVLAPGSTILLQHLRGTEKHTVCGLAYHLPALQPNQLHLVTPFLDLNELDQCPRCRNRIDPSYTPVWRFRAVSNQVAEETKRKLPG